MSCEKQDTSGLWHCGRPALHRGAHLSAEAYQQVQLLILKLEERALVVTGYKLGSIRRQLARLRHAING